MLLMAASLIGGFIFAALLTEGDVDDDDNGPDGGMPVSYTHLRAHET